MRARALTDRLGGRWHGGYGVARCPAHDDRWPSLSIREGTAGMLLRCHAGCETRDVIAALRERGLWGDPVARGERPRPSRPLAPSLTDSRAIEAALAVLRCSQPAAGTPVEAYLRFRGLLAGPVPAAIHYVPALRHPTGVVLPAMVAPVQQADGTVTGCHRTWLRPDGHGKADVRPQKAMLGRCAGGAVRLAAAGDTLQIAEGIETAVAVQVAMMQPTWASLGTSGMKALVLPEAIRRVIICADGDEAGEAAAQAAAARWMAEGRSVRVARPPRGMDFADVMAGRTTAVVEETAA